MSSQPFFIFDFDSTFIQVEALEELAAICLKNSPDKKIVLEKIKVLTDRGIEGSLSFKDGLSQRLNLIKAHRDDLPVLIQRLKNKITHSISRNRRFFMENADRVYIVSAGFKEFIAPIVAAFGIAENHVYANDFVFDKGGNITGFNQQNPLVLDEGKMIQLDLIELDGPVMVIGDGYSDSRMKKSTKTVSFYAFTENVFRQSAVEEADHLAPSFDEFLYHNKMPMALSYPKNRIKVLLLENIHPDAVKSFETEGYQVETLSGALTERELSEKISDVSILGIRSKTNVTAKVLKHAKRLNCIGAFCIGTNQIDLDACLNMGVAVFNAPFSNTRSVVELVLGEIIMLMRSIPDKNKWMHQGEWRKSADNSFEIRGKTLGIIGYGNIGSQLSVIAEALGMKVLYFDKVDKLALGNAQKCKTLNDLLKKADVVTLHVDGDPQNKGFFGPKEFTAMKKGAIFLNLSRGFVVDIKALANNILSGKIMGASVDVFPHEPKTNQEPFISELRDLPNVILTPHIGGSTSEAQENIAEYVPDKIISYINTGDTFASVNFPNLQLPSWKNAHRLIHIHQNVPGVMAQMNRVMADHGINIEGQYLKTNESVGYVITDVNKKYDQEVIRGLKEIPGTIKFRVLY